MPQGRATDAEVGGYLLERHTAFTSAGDGEGFLKPAGQ
jgi:hypothetical protein